MGNFRPSRTILAGEETSRFATPTAAGAGFDGAAKVETKIQKINGQIITTILVDLEGLVVSGTVKDIIGEDGAAAAFITKTELANTGKVYKVEMACVEAPAGTNTTADIDLVVSTVSLAEDATYDSSGSSVVLIAAGGDYTGGMYKVSAVDTNINAASSAGGRFLYLANGSGANSGGTYTAGKFIITLFGANF